MPHLFTSPEEIDRLVLSNMETLFRYPGSNQQGRLSAKEIYRRELGVFGLTDLRMGWKRIIQTHKSPWWPSIATLLSACRAEFLHRSLAELGKSLPPAKRRQWVSVKRELYLKAASNGFSEQSTSRALSTAQKWIDRNTNF